MIATPVTDSFLYRFEQVLHNMKPEVLLSASQDEGWEKEAGMYIIKPSRFETKQERLSWFLDWNMKRSDTFIEDVLQVIKEAESIIPPNDIERWVHIFRVKCEDAATLLDHISMIREYDFNEAGVASNAYWTMFGEMELKGEISKASDFVSLIFIITGRCERSWFRLRSFFENCKKMANLPELSEQLPSEIDYFAEYRETLIPNYISPTQEIELKNLLKAYHAPKKIDWLQSLDSLVTTVFELIKRKAVVVPQGVTTNQYIVYNFTHKGKPIHSGSLANAISNPANRT